jgi:hypothetical protein
MRLGISEVEVEREIMGSVRSAGKVVEKGDARGALAGGEGLRRGVRVEDRG